MNDYYYRTEHKLKQSKEEVRDFLKKNWSILACMCPADIMTNDSYFNNRPSRANQRRGEWKKWFGGTGVSDRAGRLGLKSQLWSQIEICVVAVAWKEAGNDKFTSQAQQSEELLVSNYYSKYKELYASMFTGVSNRTLKAVAGLANMRIMTGMREVEAQKKDEFKAENATLKRQLAEPAWIREHRAKNAHKGETYNYFTVSPSYTCVPSE